jgi:hypothetical protein
LLVTTGKEIGLEVNTDKSEYMFLSIEQDTGQNRSKKTGNKSFGSMDKFRYFGTVLTNQSCIHENVKNRLNLGNTCYLSVLTLLSSCLLSRNMKVKI